MKKIWIIGSSVFLCLAAGIFLITRNKGDFPQKGFVSSDNAAYREYKEHISMDEMNMTVFEPYLLLNTNPVETSYLKESILPFDLTYYKREGNKKVKALTLKKGTKIYTDPSDTMRPGAGYHSFPTFEKGWRYARPFLNDAYKTEEDDPVYYYVKLADLEKVCQALFEADESLKADILKAGLSLKEYAHQSVRYIDRIFYKEGIFCSPD